MDNKLILLSIPVEELTEIIRAVIREERTTPPPQAEVIDQKELLKRLGISRPTARLWAKKGKLPEIHIGSNVRYNWPAVVKALENQE